MNQCIKCGEQYNNVHIWNQRKIPRCKKCSGAISAFPVRSHVGLLSEDVRKAREWISKAELVIIVVYKVVIVVFILITFQNTQK